MNIEQLENFIENMKKRQELISKENQRMNNDFAILLLKIKLGISDNIKIIDGFENYCVSDNGDVYNLKFERKLRPRLKGKPDRKYYAVKLCKDGIVTQIKNHRLVALAFIENDDPNNKILVDHKDNDRLNNNVSNLRWSTHKGNSQNRNKQKDTSSKYKGVAYHKKNKKWRAQIYVNNKNKNLGYFHNEDEAARIYDFHAKLNFGEFAKLNFQ